jgi:hypothetical protein
MFLRATFRIDRLAKERLAIRRRYAIGPQHQREDRRRACSRRIASYL